MKEGVGKEIDGGRKEGRRVRVAGGGGISGCTHDFSIDLW